MAEEIKVQRGITAKELDVVSLDLEKDLEAIFNVVFNNVTEQLEELEKGKITIDEFMQFVDNI